MSSIFKAPSVPSIPAPQPISTPAPTDVDEEKLREEEEAKIRKGRKQRTTILTGPLGLVNEATVQRKTLLGQ